MQHPVGRRVSGGPGVHAERQPPPQHLAGLRGLASRPGREPGRRTTQAQGGRGQGQDGEPAQPLSTEDASASSVP